MLNLELLRRQDFPPRLAQNAGKEEKNKLLFIPLQSVICGFELRLEFERSMFCSLCTVLLIVIYQIVSQALPRMSHSHHDQYSD